MPYSDPEERKKYHYEYNKKWRQKNKDKIKLANDKSLVKNAETIKKSKMISSWKYQGMEDEDFDLVYEEFL